MMNRRQFVAAAGGTALTVSARGIKTISRKGIETVVRERDNKAGVYGAVVRRGILARGQPVYFTPAG